MKNLKSNFRKKVYYASVCCCILFMNSLNAQDLLTQPNTQKSLQQKSKNLISQKINILKASNNFNEVNLFSLNSIQQKNDLSQYIDGQVILTLEKNKIESLLNNKSGKNNITLSLPVKKGYSIELELTESKVVTNDFKIKTASGKTIKYNQANTLFYRGIVKGDPSSIVAISVFKDQIQGIISDDNGNYVLGAMKSNQKNNADYILYNDKKLKVKPDFSCDADATQSSPNSAITKPVKSTNKAVGDVVEIYIEADHQMFLNHNRNLENVEEYVMALMNEAAIIYDNEQINIALSELMIWDVIDPYRNMAGTQEILRAFADNTRNNYNGRLAHLISGRGLGGGRAYLDKLCSNFELINGVSPSGPYAVSGNMSTEITPAFPTYSQDLLIFTHELGHNFGSQHTQWCGWDGGPIDGCVDSEPINTCNRSEVIPQNGGTIMSYCHINDVGTNFNNGFGEQPGNLIRQRVADANCLATNNLALNKPSSQSSPGSWSGEPGRANDGNTNGNFFSGSVSHTGKDSIPWWEVDLTINASIKEIKIFNRTDHSSERLSNFTVSIIDRDGNATFSESFTNHPNPSVTIKTGNTIGKIVRIQLNNMDYLSLSEVEVYGVEVDLPEPYTIFPEADALVKPGKNSNKNYGTLENLNVKLNASGGNENKSFIRFDLSSIPKSENIESAVLRLYVLEAGSNSASSNYLINWVEQDDWVEAGTNAITWANAPSLSSSQRGFTGSGRNEYIETSLTSWTEWENQNEAIHGDKISIAISDVISTNNSKMKFASKEHPVGKFRPVLLINHPPSPSSGIASSDISLDVSSSTAEIPNVSIFPNPANNHINVGIDNLDLDGNIEIKVYNLLGKVIYNKQYSATAGTPFKTTLPLDNVKQGMYLMNITVNDNPYSTLRFVKN